MLKMTGEKDTMRKRIAPRAAAILGLAMAAAGCGDAPEARASSPPAVAGKTATVVDTVGTMARELAGFRAGLAEPSGLGVGSADSREGLVRALVGALERGDSVALERLALTRAEWAWLYYPASPVAAPPYELPAGIAWFQVQGNSRSGALRALRDYGGRPLRYAGHACEGSHAEGANTVWTGCTVRIDGGKRVRLFGAIVERDGRFKVVSMANDL
jgi:hypothetical protein